MPTLPPNTKYVVKDAVQALVSQGLADMLDGTEIDFNTIEIHNVDRLSFNIRITPNGSNGPRYITVKITESL